MPEQEPDSMNGGDEARSVLVRYVWDVGVCDACQAKRGGE